jgi:putative flippase GtrA
MPLDRGSLMLRYAAFALLSIAVNGLMQFGILRVLPAAWAVYAALIAGTGAGFGVKYLLDRNYIFRHVSSGSAQELWVIALYLATSIVMTTMYLGSQALMYYSCGECALYYVVGMLVLVCGYAAKFVLDGRFVFRSVPSGSAPRARC